MQSKSSSRCEHTNLLFTPSRNAEPARYKRASHVQRVAATTSRGTVNSNLSDDTISESEGSTFPAPLVLPEDELSWDPKYPPQSLRSWTRQELRNKVTPERRTIYFAAPPGIEPGLEFLSKWSQPKTKGTAEHPTMKDVLNYLKAFYHGLPVKMLPSPNLCFTSDVDKIDVDAAPPKKGRGKKAAVAEKRQTLWLNTQKPTGCIGIRTRPTPKGDFSHQLNLNDLLDAAIEILPDDAYALLMLVEHDIYEDEEDDFACGRAYGGSRVAVVSSARYNPALDENQGIEREHAWPASHCERYLNECCEEVEEEEGSKKKRKKTGKIGKPKVLGEERVSPMRAALQAHASLPSSERNTSASTLYGLWLGRVCRTASHELGHCFGIDHCVYYACSMQGTASIIEDARQPPYLCPVDLAKVLQATGADCSERYKAILSFCEKNKEAHLFAAFGAWIRTRFEETEKAPKIQEKAEVEIIEID